MKTISVHKLYTLKEKSIGLIGVNNAYPVYFTTRWGIHTFGLKFPIDVLILDKNFRVVILKPNLQPNRIFYWNPQHFRVLELPDGEIKKKRIKLGNHISLVNS